LDKLALKMNRAFEDTRRFYHDTGNRRKSSTFKLVDFGGKFGSGDVHGFGGAFGDKVDHKFAAGEDIVIGVFFAFVCAAAAWAKKDGWRFGTYGGEEAKGGKVGLSIGVKAAHPCNGTRNDAACHEFVDLFAVKIIRVNGYHGSLP
jgi:hypothetical protein